MKKSLTATYSLLTNTGRKLVLFLRAVGRQYDLLWYIRKLMCSFNCPLRKIAWVFQVLRLDVLVMPGDVNIPFTSYIVLYCYKNVPNNDWSARFCMVVTHTYNTCTRTYAHTYELSKHVGFVLHDVLHHCRWLIHSSDFIFTSTESVLRYTFLNVSQTASSALMHLVKLLRTRGRLTVWELSKTK